MLYNMDHFTSSECVGFRYAYTSWRPGGLVFPDGKDSGVGLHLRRLSSFCFHLLLSTFDWGVDFFFLPAPWRGIFTDMIFVLYFFFFFRNCRSLSAFFFLLSYRLSDTRRDQLRSTRHSFRKIRITRPALGQFSDWTLFIKSRAHRVILNTLSLIRISMAIILDLGVMFAKLPSA